MSDTESVLTVAPNPTSIRELRRSYIARAKRNSCLSATPANAPYTAPTKTLGTEWGVGVGLYFEVLKWLRWLSLSLMICAIPFLVVVCTSVFTDAVHMYSHTFGVKRYSVTQVHSLTFAAIVDDSVDNGTLSYMNTFIANAWNGPMAKSTFLTWISLVDAGSTLLFLAGLAVLWYHLKRFARTTDEDTLEAADYTVLVRGLPADVDAAQVGEHFSRYGEVMDVVIVTDCLSGTLRRCGRAARLQQQRTMVVDASKVRPSAKSAAMMGKLDKGLAGTAAEINHLAECKQLVKAAFVTFNSENERRTCTAQCPNSWLASLLQKRQDRFQEKQSFWVCQASAPDDYQFEDLAVAEWQLFGREVAINAVMLLLVLLCAAAIAKLTDISNQQAAILNWRKDRLAADSAAAMVLYANSDGTLADTPEATAAAAGDMFGGELYPQLEAFCKRQLENKCTARLQYDYGGVVEAVYGVGLTWLNATSKLLFEHAVEQELECSMTTTRSSGGTCHLQGCLPCVCLGVSAGGQVAVSGSGSSVAGLPVSSDIASTCSDYINHLDVRSWGIRLSISAVVAVLNWLIKWLLGVLVLQGRHWTHTARERSYARQSFVAMLFNTVVVLLITNCEPLAKMARERKNSNWTRFFVRYGAYNDFTPGWYENVGLSILILMLINVGGPLLNLLLEEMELMARRCCVLYCIEWPLQSDYDRAWTRPRFTLAQRISDLMLNISLALLFGSGMPILYLVLVVYIIVSELADRWALTRLCSGAPRYNTGLVKLVMALLPWAVVAHCAFGLWMHTFFRVVPPGNGGGLDEVSQLSVAVSNVALSSSSSNLVWLQKWGVWRRITQPNGLPLLLVMVGLVAWLIVGRYILWRLLSCLGGAVSRLPCVSRSSRMMRFQMHKDTEQVVNAVPYGEALVKAQLHGTPTYRLPHNPHYMQYFAASGLNPAMGVATLVVAAASGGAHRRTIYTRLLQRRGRLPTSSCNFQVLPSPILDPNRLSEWDVAFGPPTTINGVQRDVPVPDVENGHPAMVDPPDDVEDEGADGPQSPPDTVGPFPAPLPLARMSRTSPRPPPQQQQLQLQLQLAKLQPADQLPADQLPASRSASPTPDVCELLVRDERQLRSPIPSLVLGPGQPPVPEEELQQQQQGQQQQQQQQVGPPSKESPALAAAATAVAVIRIVHAQGRDTAVADNNRRLEPPPPLPPAGKNTAADSAEAMGIVVGAGVDGNGGPGPGGGVTPLAAEGGLRVDTRLEEGSLLEAQQQQIGGPGEEEVGKRGQTVAAATGEEFEFSLSTAPPDPAAAR